MRYFTSDTHYGHQNIIRFCDRPYIDVHHMNVDLVNRAAGMVNAGDELWHLGDVALGYLNDTLTNTTLTLSNGVDVKVSHFPYTDPQLDGREDRHGKVIGDKFAPWRAVDDGSWPVSYTHLRAHETV